jgi:hypothetical protein
MKKETSEAKWNQTDSLKKKKVTEDTTFWQDRWREESSINKYWNWNKGKMIPWTT